MKIKAGKKHLRERVIAAFMSFVLLVLAVPVNNFFIAKADDGKNEITIQFNINTPTDEPLNDISVKVEANEELGISGGEANAQLIEEETTTEEATTEEATTEEATTEEATTEEATTEEATTEETTTEEATTEEATTEEATTEEATTEEATTEEATTEEATTEEATTEEATTEETTTEETTNIFSLRNSSVVAKKAVATVTVQVDENLADGTELDYTVKVPDNSKLSSKTGSIIYQSGTAIYYQDVTLLKKIEDAITVTPYGDGNEVVYDDQEHSSLTVTVKDASDNDVSGNYTFKYADSVGGLESAAAVVETISSIKVQNAGEYESFVKIIPNDPNYEPEVRSTTVKIIKADYNAVAEGNFKFEYVDGDGMGKVERVYSEDLKYTKEPIIANKDAIGTVTVKYESDNVQVATVDETSGEVSINKAGNVKIKATMESDNYFATAYYDIEISLGSISDFKFDIVSPTEMTYGDSVTFENVAKSEMKPNATVTYEIISQKRDGESVNNVAEVNQNTGVVTIKAAGEIVVKATMDGEADKFDSAETTYELVISRADRADDKFKFDKTTDTVNYGDNDNKYTNNLIFDKEGDLNVTVKYTSSNTDVATVDESTGEVTVHKSGSVTITAVATKTDKYVEDVATYTLTVNTGAFDNITFDNPTPDSLVYKSGLTFDNQVKSTTQDALPTNNITYSIISQTRDGVDVSGTDKKVAVINANTGKVTVYGYGVIVVEATMGATDKYNEKKISYTLEITSGQRPDGELAFEKAAPSNIVWADGKTFDNKALINGNSSTQFKYSIKSQKRDGVVVTDVATIDKNTGEITVLNAGEIVVIATYAKDNQYDAKSIEYSLTIERADRTDFMFESSGKQTVTYGDNENEFINKADVITDKAAIKYYIESGKDNLASIIESSGKVTVKAQGELKVYAKVDKTSKHKEHTIEYTLVIKRGVRKDFKFNNPNPSAIVWSEDAAYTNIAAVESDSHAVVTYSLGIQKRDEAEVTDVAIVDVNSGKLTIMNAGSVVVYATTPQTEQYEAKTIQYTYIINRAVRDDLHFEQATPAPIVYGTNNNKYTNMASVNADAATITYEIVSGTSDVATIEQSSGIVTLNGFGTITVNATIEKTSKHYGKTIQYTLSILRAERKDFVFDITSPEDLVYEDDLTFSNKASVKSDSNASVVYTIKSQIRDNLIVNDVATINADSGILSIENSGKVVVQATTPQTNQYIAKTIEYTLVINRATPTAFSVDLVDSTLVDADNKVVYYGTSSAAVNIGVNESTGAISYSIIKGDDIASSKDGRISFNDNSLGDVTVRVTKAKDARYIETYTDLVFSVKLASFEGVNYSISGTVNDKKWYKSDVIISAPEGYLISESNYFTENTWANKLTYRESRDAFEVYFKNVETGAISALYDVEQLKIDKVNPDTLKVEYHNTVLDTILEVVTFGFYNSPIKVVLSAQDDNSGIASFTYSYEEGNDVTVEDVVLNGDVAYYEFMLPSTYRGKVSFEVMDNAGNSSKHSEDDVIVVESSAPIVSLEEQSEPSEGVYSGNATFDISVTDANSDAEIFAGIKSVRYEVRNMGEVTTSDSIYLGSDSPSGDELFKKEISDSISVSASHNNSNDVEVRLIAEDYAGNASETNKRIKIDVTAPEIEVTYDNNTDDASFDGFYDSYRTATIKVYERNFDSDNTVISIVNTEGGSTPTASGWIRSEGNGNGDNTVYTSTVTFSNDGKYKLDVSSRDIVGNVNSDVNYKDSVTPTEFVIDTTIPTMSVSYDNNAASNDNYYAESRYATVTIREHNFDASRVNIEMTAVEDGVNVSVPSVSNWESNGDENIARILYSDDALYTFNIAYSDKAGNSAAEFERQSFYIDKTAPVISISGVDNNVAYSGDVAPVITYSDNNFDKDKVDIKLTGSNRGLVEQSGSISESHNGETYTFAKFEKLESVDDIYTLEVSITDKAGNMTKESKVFSVNRFGSTYEKSDDINGKFFKNPEDVIVTEVNVNKLSNIVVTMFKNDKTVKLVENTDYSLEVTGGNGNWYKYVYTIFDKNFEEDGIYRIVLHSEDEAGNIAENTLDTKNKEIRFGVDKINPNIFVTNLESGNTYSVENLSVKFTVNDNIKLSKVIAILDGQEIGGWEGDELENALASNGELSVDISGDTTDAHNLKIMCTDAAGNETVEEITGFYVTTDIWVRYLNNKYLVIGTVAGTVAVIGATGFSVFRIRRRKKLVK